ncbi:MAG: SAM-dependent methyltransferase [Clostridia bacterium]|nr:SAM-dependent methyltransferase [Clostridia bacterium]
MLTDERLSLIIDMLTECDIIADIGADHGRLGAQLLLFNKCKTLWFSDISAPSLEKAKKLTQRLHLSDRAEFFVGDGAEAFPHAPDAAVIAGMGGVTISQIIKGAGNKLKDTKLILQPNVYIYELRKALVECGYKITDEKCVIAAKRKYILISAEPGEAQYTEFELMAGPVLLKEKSEAFMEYARFRERVIQKALKGIEKSENADNSELTYELSVWKEILK